MFRYSAWDAGSVEMAECGGGVAVEVSSRKVLLDGGHVPFLQLDEHRLSFSMPMLLIMAFNIYYEYLHIIRQNYGRIANQCSRKSK